MALKQVTLRREDTCASCSTAVSPGTRAWWDGPTRSVFCAVCEPSHRAPAVAISAAERAKRALGERRLRRRLDMEVAAEAIILHDRKVPGTREKADHVVVAPTGVWLVDAKHFTGRARRRNVGGWISSGERLFIGNHNRTKLIETLAWKVAATRAQLDRFGLGAVPVHPALCLPAAGWGRFARPFHVDGVLVAWPGALISAISQATNPELLDTSTVHRLAARLGSTLPTHSATH